MLLNITQPVLILMSVIKLGDFLIMTPLLQEIQKTNSFVTIAVPDLIFKLYQERKIFPYFINSKDVENFVHKSNSNIQVLDLTFPLIDFKIPQNYLRLKKELFKKKQHVFYNYKDAFEEIFRMKFSDDLSADPFLEFNSDESILNQFSLKQFNYFTIHAGSNFQDKNWDAKNFEQTILEILAHNPRLKCVSLVGPSDEELFKNRNIERFQTIKTDLQKVSHILSGSLFHIDNDSGIHHLAGALNVPSITVFGPTGPGTWASLTPINFIHWGGSACANYCGGLKMTECKNKVCLSSVTVKSVVGSAKTILSQYTHLTN